MFSMLSPVKKFFAILLPAVLVSSISPAQRYDFLNSGTDEGLPSAEVYSLLQDSKGYIWGCTDAGVFRYNGESFTTYTKQQGAPDNTIFHLAEDSHGRIWMSGFNGQVSYFCNDTFHAIGCSRELVRTLSKGGQVIYSMKIGAGDTLWLGTTDEMFSIAPAQNYSKLNVCSNWSDSSVTVIRQIGSNNVIISKHYCDKRFLEKFPDHYSMTYESATKYGRTTFKVSKPNSFSLYPYNHALLTRDGRLLISYFNDLYIIGKNQIVTKKEFATTIISITEDKNGDLWIGLSKHGVCHFPKGLLNAEPETMLDNFSVSDMLIDHENGIWFSTLEKGIFYLRNYSARNYSDVPGLGESIIGTTCIGDTIWAANNKGAVFIIPPGKSPENIKTFIADNTFTNFNIYPHAGKVYLCGAAFTIMDPSSGKEKNPLHMFNVISGSIDMVFTGEQKYFLLSSKELYEIDNDTLLKAHILPSRGTSVAMSNDKHVYVGTLNGLFEFDKDKFIPVLLVDTSGGTRVSQVKCFGNSPVIATKEKGIFIKRKTGWLQISEQDGLASMHCNSLQVAADGSMWVATNKGISHIVFDEKCDTMYKIFNYNSTNGLLSNEVNKLVLRGNELWAGTLKGLCVIRTNDHFYNTVSPGVHITYAMANDSIRMKANAVLEYGQNNISFFVDGFSFKNRPKITLKYQLVGYDAKEKTGHSRLIQYQNLPPGEYIFRVYCVNNNGIRSLVAGELKFSVLRSFWTRWWFITLEIIAGMIFIWLLVRWLVQQQRKKEEEKSSVVKKLAEFQLTALNAQMSPHFTFNVVNSIQRYVLKKQPHEAYTYLGRFSMLMRQVLNNANDRNIALSRELETIRLYVEMEQLRFDHKFDFEILLNKQVDAESVEIPAMLIQPFIENAIWHGVMPLEDMRKGKIVVEIKSSGGFLLISIEDNGIGREQSARIRKSPIHKSLGMSITQQRLDLLSGKAGDDSGKIIILDLKDDNGISCGTRVELKIEYVTKTYLTDNL